MSHTIEYRYAVFKIDSTRAHKALKELELAQGNNNLSRDYMGCEFYVCFVERAESNVLTEEGYPAREWELHICGTHSDCIEQALLTAGGVEKAHTLVRGREMKAENYIAAFRKRLNNALPLSMLAERVEGTALKFGLTTFYDEKAKTHAGWMAAATYVPLYRDHQQGVAVVNATQLGLEIAFLNMSELFAGKCSTMASVGGSWAIVRALIDLSEVDQLALTK